MCGYINNQSISVGLDVLLKCLLQFSFTDLTRECTLQEFTVFAKSQFPHFDVLDSYSMLFVRPNTVLEIVDTADVQENGLLRKQS